ncbi:MAG: hypothetical protein RLY65_1039 [Pseudomonadota bacterium]
MSRYQFFVSMDVQSDKEALFNEVYDSEHVPELLKVPGVLRVERSKLIDGAVLIGGVKKALANEGIARYLAVYTLSSPDVIHSEAWAVAVEKGRWPDAVRPYTFNRQHVLREMIAQASAKV